MNTTDPDQVWGPVPNGTRRFTFDMPHQMFEDLERASLRRGLPLDRLIVAALYVAATTP